LEKDSRDRLIEAATPLFAHKGYAAVSIRELAEAANTNSALISYYFGGKEGLYAAVLEAHFSRVSEMLAQVGAKSIPPVERIRRYAAAILATHQQMPCLVRFFHAELTNPTPCFEAIVQKTIARLARFLQDTIADGIAGGDFKPDLNPAFAAVSLAGMLNFYFIARPVVDVFLPQSSRRDEEYVSHSVELFLTGIARL